MLDFDLTLFVTKLLEYGGGLFLIWFLLSRFVYIHENQVGVVIKRFAPGGKQLPEGRIVALNGEPGYQARTLGPGTHFGYWPFQYKVEKFPMTAIQPGSIGLVIANDGAPMPVDRVLCQTVECDYFQDVDKFLRGGGQKGRQSAVLTTGYYRINPILFKVIPDVKMTKIDSDKVGIVTVLDGAPMPPATITGLLTIDSLLAGNLRAFGIALAHLALPASAMALSPLATILRITRASVIETLRQDYVLTERALGLSERLILWNTC